MKYLICIFVLVLCSCAHQTVKPQAPDSDLLIKRDQLFPSGTYQQKIDVTYVKEGKTESAQFDAVLKISPQDLNLYCYVGFGFTLFKLKDNLIDPPVFEAGDERVEKNKEFFLKLYPLIKEVLTLKTSDPRAKNRDFTYIMKPDDFPVHIEISKELIKTIPAQMVYENSKHFRFVVKNTDFKAL